MARGIEHKGKDSLLAAFDIYQAPNWAIFSGKEIVIPYDDGNFDQGRELLDDYLEILGQSDSNTVYTLRVYPSNTQNITDKTAYRASTTFVLNPRSPLTAMPGNPGMFILDKTQPYQQPNNNNVALIGKTDQLEQQNNNLQQQINDLKLQAVRKEYESQIAGLTEKKEQKEWWERLFETVEKIIEKPELVEKIGDGIGYLMKKKKNYIVNPSQPQQQYYETAVSGTNVDDMSTETQQEPQQMVAGPIPHPLIKQDEQHLDKEQQEALETQRINDLIAAGENKIYDLQNELCAVIAARISEVTLTRMLIKVAMLSDKDMNKLLVNLD